MSEEVANKSAATCSDAIQADGRLFPHRKESLLTQKISPDCCLFFVSFFSLALGDAAGRGENFFQHSRAIYGITRQYTAIHGYRERLMPYALRVASFPGLPGQSCWAAARQ